MSKKFFITGIGTGVGKTLVTGALTHQLRQSGKTVRAIKPIISGITTPIAEDSDAGILLAVQELSESAIDAISPWRFAAPLSPDEAARREGKRIALNSQLTFCQEAADKEVLLCEGVGGVMVPLNEQETVLDLMHALGWPVILVGSTYLGAINHTLLSLAALQNAGLAVKALIISEAEESVGIETTLASLQPFLPKDLRVITIARIENQDKPWQKAPNLLSVLDD